MLQALQDPNDGPAAGRDAFDVATFLESVGPSRSLVRYPPGATVFAQGDPCDDIRYLQTGAITLSVTTRHGRKAVFAVVGAGDFFGEGCLAGHPARLATATATMASTVLVIAKSAMIQLLREQTALADRFLLYTLARNIRIQQDLVDQLFNSSEKRLARTLLLLSHAGETDQSVSVSPRPSQTALAEMIGTTRSRVNFFMNKFRRLGFLEYKTHGRLVIHGALLRTVTGE